MAIGLEQFVKSLEDSGILTPSKIQALLPPQTGPKTVEELARELVKQNHLTKFQAQERTTGRIGLQVKGSLVEFRNIRVRKLRPAANSGPAKPSQ